MYEYIVWFRLNDGYSTAEARLQASDWHRAQMIAESMYGRSNVISIRGA